MVECLLSKSIFNEAATSPHPYRSWTCIVKLNQHGSSRSREFQMDQIPHTSQWDKRMWDTMDTFYGHSAYIQMTFVTYVSCVNIVLFKGKVRANSKVFRCPRSFKCRFHQHGKAWISIFHFLNQANRISECNFAACQNSVSEHSFEGVPGSLYYLIKSVPDPLNC